MTDQEIDAAVNAAIDAVKARTDLRDAITLFVYHAERAKDYLTRAVMERPADMADTEQLDQMLGAELQWARHLRDKIRSTTMTQAELAYWLFARRALLSGTQHRGMHLVTIFAIDDPENAVQVVSEDFERAVMLAQYAFDLPHEKRVELALTSVGGSGKC